MTGLPFRAVHQLVSNFDVGDAIGNHVRALRRLLRSWGYASDVYAQYRHMSLMKDAHFYTRYRDVSSPDSVVLFHFSIGSEVTSFFASLRDRRALVYHNITPPEYFVGVNARVADRCRRGRWELARLRNVTELALGVSEFNRQELETAGFPRTGVLPILVDWDQYAHPPVPALEEAYGRGTNLLAVGRIAPNKRVEDLVKAYYFYRRLDPGQPADRGRLGGRHRGLPGRLPEALRRARPPRARRVHGQRVAGRAVHVLPPGVRLPLSLRARGLLRARSSRRCTSTCRWSPTPRPACRAPWATPGSWSRRRTSRPSPSCSHRVVRDP